MLIKHSLDLKIQFDGLTQIMLTEYKEKDNMKEFMPIIELVHNHEKELIQVSKTIFNIAKNLQDVFVGN